MTARFTSVFGCAAHREITVASRLNSVMMRIRVSAAPQIRSKPACVGLFRSDS